ncbi:MAG TPA: porphobilinogen synthase [Spirochaetota bacterium]|nr:porphobilinogen synthase [Spirochaetota bacterium]
MDGSIRPRRTRMTRVLRDLAAETAVDRKKLIMPHFVVEGKGVRLPIDSMPGIERVSVDNLLRDAGTDFNAGIRALLLFGIPDAKDDRGTSAFDGNGIVQKAVRALKKELPDACVITDVCLCEYMSHGHCGIVKDGKILNDPTLEVLARTALSHAEAGADVVAPSDMMDGRVAAIRNLLDKNGHADIPVLSYAAKYASAFYGPFREAAGSAPAFGDRRSYQMDYRNAREAEKEILLDLEEGADMVMVKPALAYLDIIRRARELVRVPLCAYNVSGEYSMVKAAARAGFGDERALVTEILTAVFRAGADFIITYHARDIFTKGWLTDEN